jgi:hypothetical protein
MEGTLTTRLDGSERRPMDQSLLDKADIKLIAWEIADRAGELRYCHPDETDYPDDLEAAMRRICGIADVPYTEIP